MSAEGSKCASLKTSLKRKYGKKEAEKEHAKFKKTHIPKPLCIGQSKEKISNKTGKSSVNQSIRGQSVSNELKKLEDYTLLCTNTEYCTKLGNYNPEKDDLILTRNGSNLEIPSWEVKEFAESHSSEGTEDMSDEIFKERHLKLESNERRLKKWDLQQTRELEKIENLKKGRNKSHAESVTEEGFLTFLPDPANLKGIIFTNNLPLSVFGANILKPKGSPASEYYCCSWQKN